MPSLGPGELIIIFLIVLLLFGASQIPKVARGLGQGLREFKQAAKELQQEDDKKEEKKTEPPAGEDKPEEKSS
jgi:sec-independent protein translocase protein TatA